MTTNVLDSADLILDRVKNLPPAPKILVPLLAALTNPDTDVNRVVDMISVDPALTGRLLQMCNSAFFNQGAEIVDISQAISRLGFQTVYRVVALARVESFLRPPAGSGIDAGALWKHSATVGFAAQFVAQKSKVRSDLAFTAGILHDIGKSLLASAFRPDYGILCDGGKVTGWELLEREQLRFSVDHAELGARLLERWGLPEALPFAVRHHHDLLPSGPHATIAACVHLGNALAHELDTPEGALIAPESEPHPAFDILGCTRADVGYYLEEIQDHLKFVEALCRIQR